MGRWSDDEFEGPNPEVPVWHHARMLLLFGGSLLVMRALAKDPAWIEASYVNGVGGRVAEALARISALLPFSLAEIVLLIGLTLVLMSVLKGLASLRNRRSLLNLLGHGALSVVDWTLFLSFWFYLVWGLAYARPPAAERLGLEVVARTEVTPEVTRVLKARLAASIARVNETYRELHGSLDGGVITAPPPGFDANAAIEVGYAHAAEVLRQPAWFATARPAVKEPVLSAAMSYLGVAGIYVPFTGEATVDAGPPAWSRLFTAAHEKAHQRMVASEDEANFFGMVACLHADDPHVRYAAWQVAASWYRNALYGVGEEAAAVQLVDQLGAGPKRDRADVVEYWTRYDGPLRRLQHVSNDLYLKVNGVPDGVLAYDRAELLLSAWFDTPNGRRVLRTGEGDAPAP